MGLDIFLQWYKSLINKKNDSTIAQHEYKPNIKHKILHKPSEQYLKQILQHFVQKRWQNVHTTETLIIHKLVSALLSKQEISLRHFSMFHFRFTIQDLPKEIFLKIF